VSRIVVSSTRKNAGKTSLIIGMIKASGKGFGYMKPIGDRLFYRKKRLWDYDAALLKSLFGLEEEPADMTIGFEHAKLRFMYDRESLGVKLRELADMVSRASGEKPRELLVVEGGRDIAYGSSVHLDSFTVARNLDAKIVLVAAGEDHVIMDDLRFLSCYIDRNDVSISGVIVNKVPDPDDFRDTHQDEIEELGFPVLGIVPLLSELTQLSVRYLADRLYAKVIAGESGLDNNVRNIFVGAMSASAALKNPLFQKENKLIITGGDRTDMVLAAIENKTSGIVLTNNILPPSNIVSKAEEQNIPMLQVSFDTYRTVKMIDDMEPLLTPGDREKVELLGLTIGKNVNLDKVFKIR